MFPCHSTIILLQNHIDDYVQFLIEICIDLTSLLFSIFLSGYKDDEQIGMPSGLSTQYLILDVGDWQVDNLIPPLLSIFKPPVTIIEKGFPRIMFPAEVSAESRTNVI